MGIGTFYLTFGLGVLLVEILAGRHRGIYDRTEWTVLGLCGFVGNVVIRPLLTIASATALVFLLPWWKGAFAQVPVWIAFLVSLFVTEFVFYWVHRWAHEGRNRRGLGWLWQLHRTHHTARYMNTLVVLRLNVFWAIVQPVTWTVALTIYLGQPFAAALVGVLQFAWNIVTHSSFRWDDMVRRHPRFGPVFRACEHVVVSPGIHHTHHGYGRDGASYRNFALIFSFYDALFGTLHIPQGRPWRYGVPGRDARWSEQVFWPLVRNTQTPDQPGEAKSGGATGQNRLEPETT